MRRDDAAGERAARVMAAIGVAAVVWLAACVGHAWADAGSYPNRPVHVVVPWPAGGVSDTGTRRIVALMEKTVGARFVVENRPGASGQLATELVARAAPDGYTILSGDIATHGINPCVFTRMRVDVAKDFQPISMRARGAMVLVAGSTSPIKSVADLVARSKAGSEPMPYASAGLSTLQHLQMERFADVTGARLRPVLYKGEAPALLDVAGGQLPVMFAFPLVATPHVQAGKMKALAVTSKRRLPALPDVPTLVELGYPDLEVYSWGAFFAPKGTPRPIVDKLAEGIAKAAADPALREFLAPFGSEPAFSTPDELGQWVQREITRLCVITKQAGIALE